MRRKRALFFSASLVAMLMAGTGYTQAAPERWFVRSDVQGLMSAYAGAQQRQGLENFGLFVQADYLERGGITAGYNRTALGFRDSTQDITQDNLFLSGRWHMRPDWARGQVTLRLDGHAISNDDASNETDDVTVIAPQVSYLNYEQTFYADLGFSASSYGDSLLTSEQLDVDQLTPTLGFGFNDQRDWMQLRAFLIDVSSPERAQNQEDTAALEVKWTHWTMSPRLLGLDNFRFSAMLGERIFAVDPDAGSVYNLSDLQTGGASIGGEWAMSERSRILLLVGVEQYENQTLNDDYRSAFMYLNFTHEWN